jgi:hypothetical protein
METSSHAPALVQATESSFLRSTPRLFFLLVKTQWSKNKAQSMEKTRKLTLGWIWTVPTPRHRRRANLQARRKHGRVTTHLQVRFMLASDSAKTPLEIHGVLIRPFCLSNGVNAAPFERYLNAKRLLVYWRAQLTYLYEFDHWPRVPESLKFEDGVWRHPRSDLSIDKVLRVTICTLL